MKFSNPRDRVQPRVWEGKPLSFKWKYLFTNYPSVVLGSILLGVVGPFLGTIRYLNYKGSRDEAMRKFQSHFLVVRDDDERVERLKKLNNLGREHFPKY